MTALGFQPKRDFSLEKNVAERHFVLKYFSQSETVNGYENNSCLMDANLADPSGSIFELRSYRRNSMKNTLLPTLLLILLLSSRSMFALTRTQRTSQVLQISRTSFF